MNHSSILQIHLNGGENSLSSGEHSIRIFSPAAASSSASSFPLLSKGLIGRKKKISRNHGSGNRCAAWKAAAICGRTRNLSCIGSPSRKVSRDLLSLKKSLRTLIHPLVCNITSFLCCMLSLFYLIRAAPGLNATPHPMFPNWKHCSWTSSKILLLGYHDIKMQNLVSQLRTKAVIFHPPHMPPVWIFQ